MKLTVVSPITSQAFADHVGTEVEQWVGHDHSIEVVKVDRGVESIESEYDEALAGPGILEVVERAAASGTDGIFVSCFGDVAVNGAREIVDVPVVGGFEPAMLTALSLGENIGIITVLKSVVPLIRGLVRKHGFGDRCTDIGVVNVPVLALENPSTLLEPLHREAALAIDRGNVDVIVLGCTGMIGVARILQDRLEADGVFIPVVDPTGAALLWLDKLSRLGLRQSRSTYMPPPPKERHP